MLQFEQTVQLTIHETLMTEQSDYQIDELDASILIELQKDARVGVLELSRRLDVARGTVQSRLDRMIEAGVIRSFSANLNLEALGFQVKAYVTVEVKECQLGSVVEPLSKIDEVLEVHSVAAQGDLLCLIAARSNQHMMDVLEKVLTIPDIARTSTAIVLKTQIENRSQQLLNSMEKP